MTDRATIWAIVTVNAAGQVNCVRIAAKQVFMERSAGNDVLPASMVTAIVMRLMDVVLASPVTWEFDAKSLALKECMEKPVNRNVIVAKTVRNVITSVVNAVVFPAGKERIVQFLVRPIRGALLVLKDVPVSIMELADLMTVSVDVTTVGWALSATKFAPKVITVSIA